MPLKHSRIPTTRYMRLRSKIKNKWYEGKQHGEKLKQYVLREFLDIYPKPPQPGTYWQHKVDKELVIVFITPEDWFKAENIDPDTQRHNKDDGDKVRWVVDYPYNRAAYRSLRDKSVNALYIDEEIVNFYDWFVELDKEDAAMFELKHMGD